MFEQFQHIKVKIVDIEFLKQIPLEKVRNYIEQKEWKLVEHIQWAGEIKGEIWIHEQSNKAITLPIKQSFLDYPDRLSETLDILMSMENKNQLVLVEEILQK